MLRSTLCTLCLFTPLVAQESAFERPNILFLYLDDMGWRDTGFMGSDFYETPNLDRLASQGMVFTDAYSAAANCAPARASLLSGQYSPRHQIYNVGTGPRGKSAHRRLEHIPGVDTLDQKVVTWSRALQGAGYVTASLGKWHLSKDPLDYGFDINIGGTHSGSPPKGYYPPHGDVPGLQDAPEDEYLTDRLSDEAVGFIEEHRARPWVLYLTHFAVHTPLDARRDLVAKYEAKEPGKLHSDVRMATMVQAVDEGVGKIQSALERLGLEDNTIVIFSSDNGGHGPATDMDPLFGYKGTYYEGGIRVPFFVKWPDVVEAGTRSSEPVIGVDLYPTLMDMAGIPWPEEHVLDGVSLVPVLDGSKPGLEPRPLFWHFPAYLQSTGHAGEQRDPLFRSRPCSVIRSGQWKLHHFFEDDGLELYDLSSDVGESSDLSREQPERTAALLADLNTWRKQIGAAIPKQPNPKFDPDQESQAIEAKRARMNKQR